MDHFLLPWLLGGFHKESSDFAHSSLQGADLQRLIASRGALLQLTEEVPATALGVGKQAGEDIVPFSFERIVVGPSPPQDAFALLLFLGQSGKSS
jgi:hypothetical protein